MAQGNAIEGSLNHVIEASGHSPIAAVFVPLEWPILGHHGDDLDETCRRRCRVCAVFVIATLAIVATLPCVVQ
jgi:hypothetical protein